MVVTETQALLILPPIAMGIIIGTYELFLIHRDENYSGSHWFGHGLHTFIPIIIGLLISFNVPLFLGMFGDSLPLWLQNEVYIRLAIALIIAIKVRAVSAVVPGAAGRGMKEGWIHTLVIGTAVAIAPYAWPFIQPFAPSWLGGNTE
ncbi:MAG TPA: hypothetical protein HA360_00525 [Nanoarchaeota archaeon]|nr:hypothetical protein [Nanoarchaeota archaeon]HIH58465.1 hypothetical protein [Nanoarchaeota archaeon]HII13537.1 hypothetical protein [Nanoarchaeota archaeon]HIJ05141.1 hypothetical protein [Nanoarchaeota archaeon]